MGRPSSEGPGISLRPVALGVAAGLFAVVTVVASVSVWAMLQPSPEEIVSRAVSRVDALKTCAFSMRMRVRSEGGSNSVHSRGVFESPAEMRAVGTMDIGGKVTPVEQILFGGTFYVRAGKDQPWTAIPQKQTQSHGSEGNPSPTQYLDYLRAVDRIETLEPGTIAGVPCYHYRIHVDEAKYAALGSGEAESAPGVDSISEMYRDSTTTAEVWIDKGDSLPRREIVTINTLKPQPLDVYVDVTFSEFGEPVQIAAPSTPVH